MLILYSLLFFCRKKIDRKFFTTANKANLIEKNEAEMCLELACVLLDGSFG